MRRVIDAARSLARVRARVSSLYPISFSAALRMTDAHHGGLDIYLYLFIEKLLLLLPCVRALE
jgi:hypothetical protein